MSTENSSTVYSFYIRVNAPGNAGSVTINFTVGGVDGPYPMTDDSALSLLSAFKTLPWVAGSAVGGSVNKEYDTSTVTQAVLGTDPVEFS